MTVHYPGEPKPCHFCGGPVIEDTKPDPRHAVEDAQQVFRRCVGDCADGRRDPEKV